MKLPEPQPVRGSDGEPTKFPQSPGVYAVYDAERKLQYVGMSRKVSEAICIQSSSFFFMYVLLSFVSCRYSS